MRVIAVWAHIDGNFALILTNCLRTDIATGSAMYQSLTGGDAKRAALAAAANQALSPDDFSLFQAVQKAVKASRDRRNDFAHNIWAFSSDIGNALLLMEAAVVIDHNVTWRQYIEDHKKPIEVTNGTVRHVLPIPPIFDLDFSKIQVFKKPDLERDLKAAEEADRLVTLLWMLTRERGGNDAARTSLLASPQVAPVF
ncbi:MAG: hypothetical protein H0T82_09415 [Sphingomonas sp.]|nr:hypothetical protein [Sphingomonas sp.]